MKTIRFAFLFTIYLIAMGIYYSFSKHTLIEATTQSTEQTLLNHKALRKIVRHYHIPEINRLKKEGILPQDYVNPRFTSGTLLTQKLHDLTIPIQLKSHEEATEFKYASLNPINPMNKATPYEKAIFKKLITEKSKKFVTTIIRNDKPYLIYATHFSKMQKRCLRCHGDPKDAPKQQLKKYGSTSGYHFKEGDPSSLIVMRAPLHEKMQQMHQKFLYTSLSILIIFLTLYGIAEWVIFLIKKQKKKIAKNKQIRNKLIQEANKDPMTGLLNRRTLHDTMELELNRAQRDNKYLVFLFIDIDYFKQYNDTYGHVLGDEVLKKVARTLSDTFQRSHEVTYRLGGEEFGVISSHNDDQQQAWAWSNNLLDRINALKIEHRTSPFKYLTISIGGYIVSPDSKLITTLELINAADEALYQAKNSGRNQAVIHKN
jgi:diguanylate cyclase (GGDEF)-like protein